MSKRIYTIETVEPVHFHALSKARDDISFFLQEYGSSKIIIDRTVSRLEKLLFMNHNIKRKISSLNKGDIVIIQYPFYGRKSFSENLYNEIRKSGLHTILIAHDIDSVRYHSDKSAVEKEVKLLNMFDVIISHNETMTMFLKEVGVTSEIIDLGIFDYHHTIPFQEETKNAVVFAGNLQKSEFLTGITDINFKLHLYGPNPLSYNSSNIEYFGSFPPAELPKHLKGKYGLIWDGVSLDSCSGLFGEYLKYNNPHKTSLYLSCGLPVIIWKEAALASFIERNKLGIVVNSLLDIDREISKISEEEYLIMRKNVLKVAKQIRTGHFIKSAIEQAIKFIKEK